MKPKVVDTKPTVRPKEVREILKWGIKENMRGMELAAKGEKFDPLNFLLTGPPAIGKTANVEQVVRELKEEGMDMEMFVFHPVVSDPTDFKGLPFAVEGEAEFLPYGDLKKLIYATRPTVALIDDMGQASPAVQSAIMQLVWARSIGEHKVSPFVTFIAATNRREDRANVTGIIEPLQSRCTIIPMGIHLDDWIDWAVSAKLHPHIIGFVKFKPNMLEEDRVRDIENTASPRTIALASRAYETAPESVKNRAIAGSAGEVFAVEFAAYVTIASTLPDIDDWVKHPSKYKAPEQAGAKYALVYSLLARVSAETYDNIHKILEMIEKEYLMTFYHSFIHMPIMMEIFKQNERLKSWLEKEREWLQGVRSFGN